MYTPYYDILFKDKDYKRDVLRYIDYLGDQYDRSNSVLEIGCGTGSHTAILSSHFAQVYAHDIDDKMIDIAIQKNKHSNIQFISGALDESKALDEVRSACAFFNVINYIQTERDLEKFLHNILSRLDSGAFFVFDMWNGEKMLLNPYYEETRFYQSQDFHIRQIIQTNVNQKNSIVNMKYILYDVTTEQMLESTSAIFRAWTICELTNIVSDLNIGTLEFFDGKESKTPSHPLSWPIWAILRKK